MFAKSYNERPSSFDTVQLLAVLALTLISIAFVYSATMVGENAKHMVWYHQFYFKQIIWFGVGLVAALILCVIDYHVISRWAIVAYCFSIFLLVIVLIPGIGVTHGGARRWIDLGPFQLQPSEFAKLAFILAEAAFLSRPVDELRNLSIFWKSMGLIILPFLLIAKEPDLGSGLVLIPTGLIMLFVAGTPKRYLFTLVGVGVLLCSLVLADVLFAAPGWWKIKLKDYQRDRLMVYFGRDYVPENATAAEKASARHSKEDNSYQGRQALISVGSGGLMGKGWHKGDQTALGFLPRGAAHTDFIFSVIAEEKGFLGSVVVLTLYVMVLFSGIRIAGQARDRLGKLLAAGVVTLLFSHIFINIGMNIRIMPVTGVPLPLLSYGGSSVLFSLIAIGLLQNIYMYRKAY